MYEIIIFGTGGHAKVVYDIILKQKLYKPIAFVSLNKDLVEFLGLPHINQSQFTDNDCNRGLIAIGDNFIRGQVRDFILSKKPSFEFVSAIHPSVTLGQNVKISGGSVVMAGAVINSDTSVSEHVIINTGSTVDHDCSLGEFSSLAPGVTLGGNVNIGAFSAVSLGAQVIHGINVGEHSLVGAGSVVLKNIESQYICYGNPCRPIRKRDKGEKYL